jgi:hypothetical protein
MRSGYHRRRRRRGAERCAADDEPPESGTRLAARPEDAERGTAMSRSKRTTNHDKIRQWVEARNGKPARVQGTGNEDDAGLLRIDFPDNDEDDELEELSWDEFFEKFDEKRLAFVYQEQTVKGEPSHFNKFVTR